MFDDTGKSLFNINLVEFEDGYKIVQFFDIADDVCFIREDADEEGPLIHIGVYDDENDTENSVLLDPEMVKRLLPFLQNFVETYNLFEDKDTGRVLTRYEKL